MIDHDPTTRAPGSDERPWTSSDVPLWVAPTEKRLPTWGGMLIAAGIGLVLWACAIGAMALFMNGTDGTVTVPPSYTTTTVPSSSLTSSPTPVPRKVGQTFRSGDFEYRIHGVKTGIPQVGDRYVNRRAQGSFMRLDVTVKNIGDVPQTFDSDVQIRVQDTTGRTFSGDGSANLFGNPGQDGWLSEINPGNSIRAFAFYDLPKGVKAVRLLVSPGTLSFSRDVIVDLAP